MLNDAGPGWVTAQSALVANDNKAMFGSSQGNIDASGTVKEPDSALFVASDSREDHYLLFPALP